MPVFLAKICGWIDWKTKMNGFAAEIGIYCGLKFQNLRLKIRYFFLKRRVLCLQRRIDAMQWGSRNYDLMQKSGDGSGEREADSGECGIGRKSVECMGEHGISCRGERTTFNNGASDSYAERKR